MRMILPLGHGCEVTARRLQLMLNPKNERPGHVECEAKDLASGHVRRSLDRSGGREWQQAHNVISPPVSK